MAKNEPNNINDEREIRLRKLKELNELGINPYPAKAQRENTIAEALVKTEGEHVGISGRIMMKREIGKLTFCHLQDETGRMQVALKQDDLGDSYKIFIKKIDLGDIIFAEGERFTTHAGEQSVLVKKWVLLAKALLPLPDKFHGLNDEELRYRKRYLDFLVNPEEKGKILVRGKILRYLREFLYKENFIEVNGT